MQSRFRWNLGGEDDDFGNVSRLLEILLIGHGNTLFGEAVEEMSTHTARNDGGDANAVRSALDSKSAAKADKSPF